MAQKGEAVSLRQGQKGKAEDRHHKPRPQFDADEGGSPRAVKAHKNEKNQHTDNRAGDDDAISQVFSVIAHRIQFFCFGQRTLQQVSPIEAGQHNLCQVS